GVLLLTRVIGPAQFGLYAAAVGVYHATQLVAQLGMNVYLVRHPEEPAPEMYHQAAVVLAGSAALFAAGDVVLAPVIEQITRLEGVRPPIVATSAAMAVANVTLVPKGHVERALE